MTTIVNDTKAIVAWMEGRCTVQEQRCDCPCLGACKTAAGGLVAGGPNTQQQQHNVCVKSPKQLHLPLRWDRNHWWTGCNTIIVTYDLTSCAMPMYSVPTMERDMSTWVSTWRAANATSVSASCGAPSSRKGTTRAAVDSGAATEAASSPAAPACCRARLAAKEATAVMV